MNAVMSDVMSESLRGLPGRAAEVLAERGWCRGSLTDSGGAVCLAGALREASQVPGDWAVAAAVSDARGHGGDWNDAASAEEVRRWLAEGLTVTPVVLAETFGPQWAEVVRVVGQVDALTFDQQGVSSTEAARRDSLLWDYAMSRVRDVAEEHGRHLSSEAGPLAKAILAATLAVESEWEPLGSFPDVFAVQAARGAVAVAVVQDLICSRPSSTQPGEVRLDEGAEVVLAGPHRQAVAVAGLA